MTSIDWTKLIDWLVQGFIGVIFGAMSMYIAHVVSKKWEQKKEKKRKDLDANNKWLMPNGLPPANVAEAIKQAKREGHETLVWQRSSIIALFFAVVGAGLAIFASATSYITSYNHASQTQVALIHPPTPIYTHPTVCYGECWQYDENARTMTWIGLSNGTEDIWQASGEALQKIRDGYTSIITTSVPGEIFACTLTINGEVVKKSCDSVLYQIPAGTYRITSAGNDVGGFHWCPAIGYGWRVNGGECK
jgi:hypothetical protein